MVREVGGKPWGIRVMKPRKLRIQSTKERSGLSDAEGAQEAAR